MLTAWRVGRSRDFERGRLRAGKPGDRPYRRRPPRPATRTALAGETSLDECCGRLLHAILGRLVGAPPIGALQSAAADSVA